MKAPVKPFLVGFLFTLNFVVAQQHSEQNHNKYVPPTDPLVKQKLNQWQNLNVIRTKPMRIQNTRITSRTITNIFKNNSI